MAFETGTDEIGLQMKQAANSRLRRDDVGDASARKDEDADITSGFDSPTDQALIEGLKDAFTRARWKRVYANMHGEPCSTDANDLALAQEALLYMQQHVRPLVEALKEAEVYIGHLRDEEGCEVYNDGKCDCGFVEFYGRFKQALASLPPVLRGASMTSPDSEPMENV